MTERDERILHKLAHPASARAVEADGLQWRGSREVLALLNWSETVFALWRAGIAVPGPSVEQKSIWFVRDA